MGGKIMITTATAGISPTFPQAFYDRNLLDRLHQAKAGGFIHDKWAQKRPMPKKNGDTIDFRRFGNLAPATTPLTEGATPAGSSISITNVRSTTNQYGDFVEFSDLVDLQAIDPLLTETGEILGDQAAETLDIITRDELAAGTQVIYANGKTSRATVTAADKLTTLEMRKAVRLLKKNKVKPAQDGYYVLLVAPDTTFDLQDDPKWIDVEKYGRDMKDVISGEIGKIYGVRVVETINAKFFEGAGGDPDGAGALLTSDVFASIMLGANAYGTVEIAGEGDVQNIIKPLGSSGATDPLNQRQTSGWKVNAFAAKRLQELAIVRIEHGATDATQ
jgi:N4-gp56 family major capsid protein